MIFLIAIILLMQPVLTFAQDKEQCGSAIYEAMMRKKIPFLQQQEKKFEELLLLKKRERPAALPSEQKIYTIPVVVHILYNKAGSNISDELVHSQIKVLNEDYRRLNRDSVNTPLEFRHLAADCQFQFCLATRDPEGNITTGIIRKKTSQVFFNGFEDYSNDTLMKSISRWPNDQYLNIWVTNLTNITGANTLGYSMNPATNAIPDLKINGVTDLQDGVVVHYNYFGVIDKSGKYTRGRTATHEVGHWLGLKHIWGDNFCGEDFVDDTPLQEESNKDISPDNCTHFSNCNNQYTRDMSCNYMDYSPDQCMNMFTKSQKNRMRTVVETNIRRLALQYSTGCCNPGLIVSLPFFQGFEKEPANFKITNPDLDNTWTLAPYGGYGLSTNSFQIVNNTSTSSHYDMFETPDIDFVNSVNPVLEFSLATALNPFNRTSDSLAIFYNSNCSTYVPLKMYTRTELSSIIKTEFTPSSLDWKKFKINLKDFAGKKIARIQFKNYSEGKNNLYIDDINIYDSIEELQLSISPNPANTEIMAQFKYKEPSDISMIIYNSIGQVIEEITAKDPDFRKKIDISSFSPGLYFIKAVVEDQKVIKKFVVADF